MNAEHHKLIRLYVPESGFAAGENLLLSEQQAHYLRNVMRKTAGERVRVFNGVDGEWLASLEEISKNKSIIKLSNKLDEQKSSPDIWVLASPIKKEPFDLMIEKACELGASKFIPVLCERTVVHKINRERLQAIAVEAAEQSERLDVMTVEPSIDLKKCLNSFDYNRNLIFCLERAGAMPLQDVLGGLAGKPLALLIGPEGGFSPAESDFASKLPFVHPASLGPRILRAETAAISALAIAQLLAQTR